MGIYPYLSRLGCLSICFKLWWFGLWQKCLSDWIGRACRMLKLEDLLIQHTESRWRSSQILLMRGVAVSIIGCRLRINCPGIPFIGNLAGRPLQHFCTFYLATLKHAELWLKFSPKPGKFRNCHKDTFDLDFNLTVCVVSKCPYWGQRPHPRPLCTKGVGGVWVSAGLVSCQLGIDGSFLLW
jgi:hypothetical protein